jgi:glycosyltransferase involved in cell wall biosynthesis
MKILMVVHQFLPRHLAGSELYTYHLARALRARGHDVTLFFTEIRFDRPPYELTHGEFEGIPFFEAVNNRRYPSFRHSYRDPEMDGLFQRVLDATASDVIHLQHLHLHSIGYVDIARRRKLPVLYTLHEYLLMCLNDGLLLRPGAILCEGPDPLACANCAVAISHRPDSPPPTLDAGARSPLSDLLHRLAAKLGAGWVAERDNSRAYRAAAHLRRREIQAALDKVDLFLAPSRFLRQRFVEEGMIRPERILHSDYGFFVEPFTKIRRSPSPVLRVGYVGTISEYKGVHLVVEAFRGIREPGIQCQIYGGLDVFPDYAQRLLAAGIPPAVRFMGRLENANVAATLAGLDLLIVPSLWFENSPLTIHEAFLAGLPVVTSDRGGMAELVEHDKSGLLFRIGDAADLRRQVLRLLHEPGLLESLRKHLPAVKTIENDAADMERRYQSLLEGRLPVS